MAIFESTFYLLYKGDDGGTYERPNAILHEAESVKQAIDDAVRFYRNRLDCDAKMNTGTPYWSPLGALKISQMAINPISADGAYDTRRSMTAYEWKCDWGLPLGERG